MALRRLEETQQTNKSSNRAPRGIRSRTHTVYMPAQIICKHHRHAPAAGRRHLAARPSAKAAPAQRPAASRRDSKGPSRAYCARAHAGSRSRSRARGTGVGRRRNAQLRLLMGFYSPELLLGGPPAFSGPSRPRCALVFFRISAARCAFEAYALRRQWAVAVSSSVAELCSRVRCNRVLRIRRLRRVGPGPA